jgi:hypothetical protein
VVEASETKRGEVRCGVVATLALGAVLMGCGEESAPEPGDARVEASVDVAAIEDRGDAEDGATVDRAMPLDAGVSADVAADVRAPSDGMTRADAGTPDVMTDVPGADAATGAVIYPATRTQSPITADVASNLRAIAARGPGLRADVFAKVGASNTVNTNFLHCFGGTNVDLAGRTQLQWALDAFRRGDAAGQNPFQRVSLAATVGWSAWSALAGTPSPLQREVDAIRPRYAVVMFGTNDIQSRDIHRYGANLLDIADTLARQGVIALFSSVPPRDDNADADLWVPRYNAVARGVAQSRRLPFIDLHRELVPLPRHGLGSDGIHMNVYTSASGAARGCVFTSEGLRYGFNARNVITLEALQRATDVVERGRAAPDPNATRLTGEGTPASPFVVASLPFADSRDTTRGGGRSIARYPGCNSNADESGAEFYYRVMVDRPTRVRAMVITRGTVDIDVHLLRGGLTGDQCVVRDDRVIVADLPAGASYFVLDTYVSSSVGLRAGEYLFVVTPEP